MPNPLLKLASWIPYNSWPSVPCPACGEGTIQAAPDAKLLTSMDPTSLAIIARVNAGLDAPEELKGSCSGKLICTSRQCRAQVLVSGDWLHAREYDDETGREPWTDFIRVRLTLPTLPIFTPPPSAPESVTVAITSASELLWINPNAAANQLRQAIEELLTHKRVRRYTIDAKGKRKPIATHSRIDMFRAKDPIKNKEVADTLEAVKWIGNSGSHTSTLVIADVLEGAGLLEHALTELYDRTNHKRRARVKQINARKGIPRTTKP